MAPCFKELLPFVNDNSPFYTNFAIAGASVSHGHISSFEYGYPLNYTFMVNAVLCHPHVVDMSVNRGSYNTSGYSL